MRCVDYSSAMTSIVSANFVSKLRILCLINVSLTSLRAEPKMGNLTSSALALSPGEPQGCVLS